MDINSTLLMQSLIFVALFAVVNGFLAKAGGKNVFKFVALSLIPFLTTFLTLYLIIVIAMNSGRQRTNS